MNVQPFLSDRLAFCHNGSLALTLPEGGASDSLTAFRSAVSDGGSAGAVGRAIESGRKSGYTSATSVVTDGENTSVLLDWNEEHPLAEKYGFKDYYTMSLFSAEGLTIACSELLPSLSQLEHRRMENGEALLLSPD